MRLLKSLAGLEHPIAFYESPRRVVKSLKDCLEVMGDRPVFLGRELIKIHEELFHSHLSEVITELTARPQIKGEFVVVIGGAEKIEILQSAEDLDDILAWYKSSSGMSMRDACRKIATDLGVSRSEVYNRALELWQKNKRE